MNIFVLDDDPFVAASMMDCQRVPKMCVETAQMMACAVLRHGATEEQMPLTKSGTPYRGGYGRHPCSVWAGDSRDNFAWLTKHGIQLCREYKQRFGKTHACHQAIIKMGLLGQVLVPEGDMTPFAQAMPDEYKHDDAVIAYRRYYKSKDNVHYRHTEAPDWFVRGSATPQACQNPLFNIN